jgi:hypothetical protein
MIDKEKYILYLQLTKRLDTGFIRMAAELKQYGVHLIPVQLKEIDHFLTSAKVPLIVVTNTIKSWTTFQKSRKSGIDFFLKAGKIKMFHFNSFKEIIEYRILRQKGYYQTIALPIRFEKAIYTVLADYEKGVGKDNSWPGGKRSKLPQMSGK